MSKTPMQELLDTSEAQIKQLKAQLESQRRLKALMDEFNTKERSNLNKETP